MFWECLKTAAEGERENIAGVAEHWEVGLVSRVVVLRCNREPIGERPGNSGCEEHDLVTAFRCAAGGK